MTSRERYRVAIFVPSLTGGGAERVAVRLLQAMNRNLFEPMLVLVQPEGAFMSAVPSDVLVIATDHRRVRYALPDLLRILQLHQPDILLSIMHHSSTIALMAKVLSRGETRFIVSEQTVPSIAVRRQGLGAFRLTLMRWLYRLADAIVATSEGVAADLSQILRMPHERITRIHNPAVDRSVGTLKAAAVHHPWFADDRQHPVILGCGRLTTAKGFSYLIEAVFKLQRCSSARLAILGEGELGPRLRQLVKDLDLEDKVAFLGFRSNPYRYMAKADVFALSSLWEGLGLAIIEAMACGAPVVSTDCPTGPGEILTHGVNGLLVPPADPQAMADALHTVLTDRELAHRLSKAGLQRAEDFRVERIAREYEKLFLRVLEDKASEP